MSSTAGETDPPPTGPAPAPPVPTTPATTALPYREGGRALPEVLPILGNTIGND
ncbi:hypothetical protein [Salinactinospora qingdaonensis]|uniref:hypothetical protein n=1 Tax=Salinactinospora qingdaonensis TaxID=702744 RepID=UPI0031EBF10D